MSYSSIRIAKNPLHYFRLDENNGLGGFIDLMGNQNGVYVNSPTFKQPWSPEVDDGDGCVYFSTNQRAQVVHSSVLNSIDYLVIEALFKLNSFAATSSPYQNPIINKWGTGSSPDDWFEIFVHNQTHKLWATAANGSGPSGYVISNTSIALNVWYRFVYIFDHGNLKLFIDDVLEAEGDLSFTTFNPGLGTPSLGIGGHASYTSRPFDGWVDEVVIYNNPWPLQELSFFADPTEGIPPLSTQFTNTSFALAQSIQWDFGDGETSTEENPLHTYQNPGRYSVTLTYIIYGTGEILTLEKTDYIIVTSEGVEANFTADATEVYIGEVVSFSDISVGVTASWSWDFGDGGVSTEENPVHSYMSEGYFTVSLTVSDTIYTHTETKIEYIRVSSVYDPLPTGPTGFIHDNGPTIIFN